MTRRLAHLRGRQNVPFGPLFRALAVGTGGVVALGGSGPRRACRGGRPGRQARSAPPVPPQVRTRRSASLTLTQLNHYVCVAPVVSQFAPADRLLERLDPFLISIVFHRPDGREPETVRSSTRKAFPGLGAGAGDRPPRRSRGRATARCPDGDVQRLRHSTACTERRLRLTPLTALTIRQQRHRATSRDRQRDVRWPMATCRGRRPIARAASNWKHPRHPTVIHTHPGRSTNEPGRAEGEQARTTPTGMSVAQSAATTQPLPCAQTVEDGSTAAPRGAHQPLAHASLGRAGQRFECALSARSRGAVSPFRPRRTVSAPFVTRSVTA